MTVRALRYAVMVSSLVLPLSSWGNEPKVAPPPPSTGKEAPSAPAPDPVPHDEAAQALNKLLDLAAKPKPACETLITPHTRLVLEVADPDRPYIKAHIPGFLGLARCAEKQKYYGLMREIGSAMVHVAGTDGHPEVLVRALMGLEAWDGAAKTLVAALKESPDDPDLALVKTKLMCRARDWKECLKGAKHTIDLAKKMEDSDQEKEILNRAFKYAARGLLHVGKLDDAAEVADQAQKLGGDPVALDAIRQSVLEAQTAGAVIDIETRDMLALGTYHLVGKVKGMRPLAEISLTRVEKPGLQYRIEAEVAGITSRFSRTVAAMPFKDVTVELSPPLKPDLDPDTVRSARQAQLDITITAVEKGGDHVVMQKSFPITLQPRDFLPLASFSDKEGRLGTIVNDNIAAWVTPNAKAVDTFLAAAKKRAPRETFAGEQAPTVPQVKALYDELQSRGMSYVMDPDLVSADGVRGQRTRLPSEVLSSTNAQCLEGSILFATLFEAIGLKPIVVRVPGHAFVGWAASVKYDKVPPGTYYFLETTMTHDAPFDVANKTGVSEYREHAKKKAAQVVAIETLRKEGVSPQPFAN